MSSGPEGMNVSAHCLPHFALCTQGVERSGALWHADLLP